jgi:hypothetical protein
MAASMAKLLLDGPRDFDGSIAGARLGMRSPRQQGDCAGTWVASLFATLVELAAPKIVEMDDETGLRVWDRHPGLIVHQGVEVVMAAIHLGLFQRGDGFVREILDAEGASGRGVGRRPGKWRPLMLS